MAFPTILQTAYSEEATNTTTHDVSVPAGLANDDLLLLFISFDGDPTVSGMPAGWIQALRQTHGTIITVEVWYKIVSGLGVDVIFSYTTSASETSTNRLFHIRGVLGATAPQVASAIGRSNAPNPPSLTPSGLSEDALWIAYYGADRGNRAAAAFPINYNDNQFTDGTGGNAGTSMGSATRDLDAISEDPGTFSMASEQWIAVTVGIRPLVSAATELKELADSFTFSDVLQTEIAVPAISTSWLVQIVETVVA